MHKKVLVVHDDDMLSIVVLGGTAFLPTADALDTATAAVMVSMSRSGGWIKGA